MKSKNSSLKRRQRPRRCGLVFGMILGLGAAAGAAGQPARFSEDFESMGTVGAGQQGPSGLIQGGWTFRNQSSPIGGAPAWSPGGASGWAYEGSGFLRSSSSSTGFIGAMSNWAILPPVEGIEAGDVFSVWVLDGIHGGVPTYLEVRRSPGGGTGTGTSATDVGDFTEVVFSSALPITQGPFAYALLEEELAGAGRLAIRFYAPNIHAVGGVTANLYLDSLRIGGGPSGPPCGLELPEAGETVVWDAAGSPYVVCQDLLVPEGATLVIGEGATLVIEPGRELFVEGELVAQGTAGAPVVVTGNNVSGLRVDGTVTLHHTDINAAITCRDGSTFEAYDSILREDAWLFPARNFVRLERCEARTIALSTGGSCVLEDVTVTNPATVVTLQGFWRIGGIDSVAPITFRTRMQNRSIDNVTVTGVSGAPALDLQPNGGPVEFHLGAANVLQGNQYPVWARFGGLTPDSVVPESGNTNNAILGPFVAKSVLRSRVSLPNLGIPYHFLDRGRLAGDVRVGPGSVLKFGPTGGLTIEGDAGTDGWFRGLPGAPIRLERLDPAQAWFSLATAPGWHIFEHLDVSGAGVGVVANESILYLRESVIHGNGIGAYPAAEGQLYGSGLEFYGNQLGVQNDTVNLAGAIGTGIHLSGVERPNIFEGNTLAAENLPGGLSGHYFEFPIDHNWWGHETGPHEAMFHPQGQGDPVSAGVEFQPLLTQRPDLSDRPPVVRLKTRVHPVVLPGEKVFIEWEASDDGQITGFDVQELDWSLDPETPILTFNNVATGLPPTQRRFEVIVPEIGLHPYERLAFRIVAHDDAGNSSFEQFWFIVPHQAPAAEVAFHTPLGEFRGGERIEICYDAVGLSSSFPVIYVETGADDRIVMDAAGPPGAGACTYSTVEIPYASSDRVRLALRAQDNFNRDEWYFSEYFTVRPDPRMGDAAPEVSMTSPAAGAAFPGGGTIPISWTASDDLALRAFRIQASFNGGYTFHTIADDLPSDSRSFSWRLPASTGVADVRLRVVAIDSAFQNTSSGDDRVVSVGAGGTPACPADWSMDGAVNSGDISSFLGAWLLSVQEGTLAADFSGDGLVNSGDISAFLTAWLLAVQGGC